jgi:NAD(P)H-quinone oxidoreductase subunit 5
LHGGLSGLLMIVVLTAAALLAHALPLGLQDAPDHAMGVVALVGMGVLYGCLVLLQVRPQALEAWRRWSYAGFYVDEYYTRLALWLWPTRWTPEAPPANPPLPAPLAAAISPK